MAPASLARPATLERVKPYAGNLDHLLAGLAVVDIRIRAAVAHARAAGRDPHDEFTGLYITESQVDGLLDFAAGRPLWPQANGHATEGQAAGPSAWPLLLEQAWSEWGSRTRASRAAGVEMRLDRLALEFALDPVEVEALLIALAPELEPRYERLFAYLQDDVTRKRPSVDLALNLLADSFEEKVRLRRFFTEDSTLVRSRLLERTGARGESEATLLAQGLRPARRVVEHLLSHDGIDGRLRPRVEVVWPAAEPPSTRLPAAFIQHLTRTAVGRPLFAFVGPYGVGRREAAQHIARAANTPLLSADLSGLAALDGGLEENLPILWREGRLLGATLYLASWDSVLEDGRPPQRLLQQLLDYPGTVIVGGETTWQPGGIARQRPVIPVGFERPATEDRLRVWRQALGPGHESLPLEALANHFQFTPGQIEDAVASARDLSRWREGEVSGADLFTASRAHSNQKLSTLATKITPRYGWQEIILPPDAVQQLKEMVITVRQRPVVYEQWGFERKMALGKGLNALFAGESGTGKTMAADIMAGELGLDLYKIDLSTLVSKYIGETEKNLNRIFTEAQTSNAILFFDEADAVFGKRSEVRDSHDRYANMEVSYLLQRMESYDGVVILATNMRANLDEAFTRRLHFIVEFPFPEAADRERIWRVNVPPEMPLAAAVDFKLLAQRFRLAGGNIRNIILAAAFMAAETGEAVSMRHLLHGTRREYQKMGRLIDEVLFVWREEA